MAKVKSKMPIAIPPLKLTVKVKPKMLMEILLL